MITFYLVLAHLTADFLLQPQKLLQFKERSFWGVVMHAGIHITLSLLLLMPYLGHKEVWLGVFIIGIAHALIDQGKISIQYRIDKFLYPFLLDQLFHFVIIFSVILYFQFQFIETPVFSPAWLFDAYKNPLLPILLEIFVFVTAVYDIARFQLKREKNKKSRFQFSPAQSGLRIALIAMVFMGFLLLGYFFKQTAI